MMGGLSPAHLMIVALVVLVLFGRGRISDMMGDFGKGIKSFKEGMADENNRPVTPPPSQIPPSQIAPVQPPMAQPPMAPPPFTPPPMAQPASVQTPAQTPVPPVTGEHQGPTGAA